jgi:Flp pilus assembly protein TadG
MIVMRPGWTTWRSAARDKRGAEIAETAMILPLLFMMLMAIFWFGQAFRIYGTITHAAREGARAAVAPVCATCVGATNAPTQNAITAVDNALAAAHLNSAQVQKPVPVPLLCPCGSPNSSCGGNAVSCDASVSTSNVCVQPNVQLSYINPQGGAGSCGTSVSFRYKYPYRFVIPLTTLDLGNISLPAQAQMRVETQ